MKYAVKHEAPWYATTTGAPSPSRHRHVAIRKTVSLCGAEIESILELGDTMAADAQEKRPAWALQQPLGTPFPFVRETEREDPAVVGERCSGGRPYHRAVDIETDFPTDRKVSRGPLLSGRRLEITAHGVPVEFPKAGTSCHPKKRKGNCVLEAERLAAYKKKPKDSGPTWRFSMKAASCSFPTSVRPGPPWGRLQCYGTAIAGTRSRLSGVLRFLPAASAWGSISDFTSRRTLRDWGSSLSWSICCATCPATLSSSGTAARSTRVRRSRLSLARPRDFMFTLSQDTPPRSIQSSRCGLMGSEISLTACMRGSIHWHRTCAPLCAGFGTHNNSFDHASSTLSCLGHSICIHY